MSKRKRDIRFAVVGLGHIAQAAVLPAFQHGKNAKLIAIISGDEEKRDALGERYRVRTYAYEQLEECVTADEIDAVFIAVPNDQHREYAVRSAHAGAHVLCEKPMAINREECGDMIEACVQKDRKLMIGYRLHFEAANLKAIDVVKSGKLGEPRLFNSVFAMQVKPGNIRVQADKGGGAIYDIGIYCINAARYIFQDEPTEVFAWYGDSSDERFQEVDEMTSALLRFPGGKIAQFTCSFNGPPVQQYTVMGTKGALRVDPAFDYSIDLKHHLTLDGDTKEETFAKRDQFAAEIEHFAKCILEDRDPEPDGWEGMADVQIIEAIRRSARIGSPVKLVPFPRDRHRTEPSQAIAQPPAEEPDLVKVEAPTIGK